MSSTYYHSIIRRIHNEVCKEIDYLEQRAAGNIEEANELLNLVDQDKNSIKSLLMHRNYLEQMLDGQKN